MAAEGSLDAPIRYCPNMSLPPYTYVPRQQPHPKSDPSGHGCALPHVEPDTPIDARHPVFRYAVDLFNSGFYWESHEAWEDLWHQVGRRGTVADLLKGLIKLAAAGVKIRERIPGGVVRHAQRGLELFDSVGGDEEWSRFGVSSATVRQIAENFTSQWGQATSAVPLPTGPLVDMLILIDSTTDL